MEILIRIFNYIILGLLIILTVVMLLTFRKPRVIGKFTPLLSFLISFLILVLIIILSGARLNPLLFVPIFCIGVMVGLLYGISMKLYIFNKHVIGKQSWLFLLCFGISLVVTHLLIMTTNKLYASLGLIPLIFSVGTVFGREVSIFVRRIRMQKYI